MRPDNLEANKLYEIVFQPDGNVRTYQEGRIHMNWQISANFKWITTMENNSSSRCDLMSTIDYLKDQVDHGYYGSGFNLVSGSYGDDIPSVARNGWYYFSIAPGDSSSIAEFVTYNGMTKDMVCWDDEYEDVIGIKSGIHNESGVQFCSGQNGQSLFLASLGEYYHYQDGGSAQNTTEAVISTEGYLTHIIHPDYRCSNNLCWAPGGDTNCYDAHTHYEIRNGDITDIVKDNLDKYQMCAEVYSDRNVDDDGDGFTENQGDMDDYDASIHPVGNSEGNYGNGPYNTDPKDGMQYPVTSVSEFD